MDERSIEILEQLKAEVWWPWDRRGGPDGGYNLRPVRPHLGQWTDTEEAEYKRQMEVYEIAPNINRQRWLNLIGELIALNPQNPEVPRLRRLYQQPSHRENTKNRQLLIEVMLR